MNEKRVIQEILKYKKISHKQIAPILGYSKSENVSWVLIQKGSMRVDRLMDYLNAMNCELVIRDKDSDKEWTIEL